MSLENALREQAAVVLKSASSSAPVTKLKGDASNRSYYRVGTFPDSVILMVMPVDAKQKSEEATKGAPPKELPFVNVHRYLSKLGVRVPIIHRYDEPAGMMVLEDLSDLTFEQALSSQSKEKLYGQAVDLLAKIRLQAERSPDPECLAFTRSFDEDLYDWELHHFREYGLEIWSGRKPEGSERERLDSIFKKLARDLAAEPKGFTHRDYQSRNLMLKNGELVVIDFQDALLGPRQYDLVALLRDSYVELDEAFVESMLHRYLDTFESLGGSKVDRAQFVQFFHRLTIQRKLKDAGRFEFINRVKGNPSFLVSIPASLRYVRAAFKKVPELQELQAIVSKYVPELAP